jgi:hypothetical protein
MNVNINKITKRELYLALKKHLGINGYNWKGEWRLSSNQMYKQKYVDKKTATKYLFENIMNDIINLYEGK